MEVVKKNPVAAQEEKLKAALKELGGGKNKVAAALREKKVKGVMGDTEECPIARYIAKIFRGRYEEIEVDGNSIDVRFAKGSVHLPAPKAISDFIGDFDEEKYPDLILEN